LVYLDDSRVKIIRRAEKEAEFRSGSYSNGYRDNNNYPEKPKTYYYYYKKDKKRDRFLNSQKQHQRRLEEILYSLTKLVNYLIPEVSNQSRPSSIPVPVRQRGSPTIELNNPISPSTAISRSVSNTSINIPKSTPTDSQVNITIQVNLLVIPLPDTPDTPYFEGVNISEFIERFENICDNYQIRDKNKIKRVPRYYTQVIGQFIKEIKRYQDEDWNKLKKELKKEY